MNNHYAMLVEALKLTAAEADMQIRSLPDFVVVTDEIALNFDDVFIYKDELLREKLISEEVSVLLDKIDKKTEFMSDNKVGWALEELKNSDHWKEIRGISRKILSLLGEEPGAPDLGWITYIPAKRKSWWEKLLSGR
jgi:hypothetical protein